MGAIAVVLKLLDLVVAGSLAYEDFVAMKARVQAMKDEGRDPTDEEWNEIFAEAESYVDRIAKADEDDGA